MRSITVAASVAAFAFAVAGCGGSNDAGSEAASDTAVAETSTAADTSQTTDATATETISTEANTGVGLTGECADLVEASQKFGAAAAAASGGGGDLGDTADAFKQFAEVAPDELKDDFEALADVMTEYAGALADLDLKAGDVPTADQIAKLAQLGQSLGTEKVQKASAAIAAWSQANC